MNRFPWFHRHHRRLRLRVHRHPFLLVFALKHFGCGYSAYTQIYLYLFAISSAFFCYQLLLVESVFISGRFSVEIKFNICHIGFMSSLYFSPSIILYYPKY